MSERHNAAPHATMTTRDHQTENVGTSIPAEGKDLFSMCSTGKHVLTLLDATDAGVIAFGPDGIITTFNKGAEKLLGYSRDEVVGQCSILDFHDQREVADYLQRAMRENAPFLQGVTGDAATAGPKTRAWCYVRKDGSRIFVKTTTSFVPPHEGGPQYLVLAEDVTKSKKIENQLRESRKLLSLVIESIPSPVFYKDCSGRYVDCNQTFCDYLGLTRSQIMNKTVYEVAPSELAKVYHEADLALMANGGKQVYETSVRHADGTDHDVMFHKAVLEEKENGQIHGIVGVMLDITKRKNAERSLRRSNEQLRMIFEASQAGIILIDGNGIIQKANPGFARMVQLRKEEIVGMRYSDFLHQDSKSAAEHCLSGLMSGEMEHAYSERRYVRKDGTDFWGMISAQSIADAEGNLEAVVGIIVDITETNAKKKAGT